MPRDLLTTLLRKKLLIIIIIEKQIGKLATTEIKITCFAKNIKISVKCDKFFYFRYTTSSNTSLACTILLHQ